MLKFNLLDNGLDSLGESVDYFISGKENDDPRLYKYAILLIAHSVELILKHILEQEHSALIFDRIDDIGKKPENDLYTVDIKTCLSRITNICKIFIPKFCEDTILKLIKERNIIQHFKVSIAEEVIENIFSETYAVIKYLLKDTLKIEIRDYIDEDIIEHLEDIQALDESRKKTAREIIKSKKLERLKFAICDKVFFNIPCPICKQKTLAIEGDKIKCFFCLNEFKDWEDCFSQDENSYIRDEFSRQILYRKDKDIIIKSCPDCGDDLIYLEHEDRWLCINCFGYIDSISCTNCGNPIPDHDSFRIVGSYYEDEDRLEYECICEECMSDEKYMDISN